MDDEKLLQEVYRLIEIDNEDFGVYELTEEQMNIARKPRENKKGQFLNR